MFPHANSALDNAARSAPPPGLRAANAVLAAAMTQVDADELLSLREATRLSGILSPPSRLASPARRYPRVYQNGRMKVRLADLG